MSGIERLLEIMAQLRDPVGGCPWDLEQDFETISPFTIEEAYEVDEAIARGDLEALRDELGDLLFQVVFQARIAEERGAFDFEGVTQAIGSKLVRRHPHVFGGADTPGSVEAQTASWEAIKAAEREAAARRSGDETSTDPFEGIPRHLPALARSAKIAGRITHLDASDRLPSPPGATLDEGEDSRQGGFSQADRSLRAIDQQLAAIRRLPDGAARDATDLIGRGLQAFVGLARALGVDPEQALRRADDVRMDAARASNRHQAGNSTTR